MLLALCVGQMRGTVDDATVERIVRELKNMPLYIKDVLGLADKIKNLSKIYTYARNFLYLGRGYNYPTALEGALKLKEISYIHAEGYPAAEMKFNSFLKVILWPHLTVCIEVHPACFHWKALSRLKLCQLKKKISITK